MRRELRGSSIQARLSWLTALLTALVLVGGVVALLGMRDALEKTDRQVVLIGPVVDANRSLRVSMIEAQASLRGHQVATGSLRSGGNGGTTVQQAEDFLARYTQAQADAEAQLRHIDAALGRDTYPMDASLRVALQDGQRRQREAQEAWMDYARAVRSTLTITTDQLNDGEKRFRTFEDANDALGVQLGRVEQSVQTDMRDTMTSTQNQVMIATAVALVLAALIGWWTTRDLTVPLRRLRDAMRSQRAGNHDAWADEASGTREVRELAAGLNALTVSQHAMVDEQRYALHLSQVARDLSRRIQDAADVESAFVMAAEGVGRSLAADHVQSLVTQVVGGERGACAVWTPSHGVSISRMSEDALDRVEEDVALLWAGERCLVVDNVDGAVLPPTVSAEFEVVSGACILAAFGSGDSPRGVMSIRILDGPRGWTQAEASFVQQIAAELGRGVVAVEVGRARSEQVARLEELDRQKDAFLSTVSHELRTPLTSMTGYLELLEDGDAGELTQEQKRMLSVIDRNAVRLRALIEDLLFLNRMRSDPGNSTDLVPLDALVEQTCEEMLPLASSRGVLLDLGVMAGLPVPGDRTQIARVLTNIVSNAVKFTPAGGRVRVSTAPVHGADMVRVVCADEGMGIPEEEQDRLFTRFFRASNATKHEVPGTGLGLVVVRGIVEAHGGRLSLSSVEGVGTTVVVELPLTDERGRVDEGAMSSTPQPIESA